MNNLYPYCTLYTGPMYAGKTTELIKKYVSYERIIPDFYSKVGTYKFSLIDKGNVELSSHDKRSNISAQAIQSFGEIDVKPYLFIDEIQFAFHKETITDSMLSELRNSLVFMAGVNLDYKGNPFLATGFFACVANHVNILSAVCGTCGEVAHYTRRISQTTGIFDEAAEYQPVCGRCRR